MRGPVLGIRADLCCRTREIDLSAKSDVIVLGLGAMGSATCHQLAARGLSVIGIDQYQPPHPHGSTHGETRMTRLAIGEGQEYVPLARRSHELWREIEQRTGANLLTQCGGLILGEPANPFLSDTRKAARAFGIAHENLTSPEVRSRFPMFAIGSETEGYFEPEAGYVRPEAAVRTQLALARARGAALRLGERAEGWTAVGDGVTVTTTGGRYEAQELVLCAGAWIPELFAQGSEIFSVYRQNQVWFPIREHYDELRDMPVFAWEFGASEDSITHLVGFYGFPGVDGPAGGVKVAAESYEQTTSADSERVPTSRDEIEEMYGRYVASRLPWLDGEPVRAISCLYTTTRGNRFLIDRHPEHESVLIVSPCSGHGFKHSAAIGESVAQLVVDRSSEIDLRPFRLAAGAG